MYGKLTKPLLQEDYVDVCKSATPVGAQEKGEKRKEKEGEKGKGMDGLRQGGSRLGMETPKVDPGVAWLAQPKPNPKVSAIATAIGIDPSADAAIMRQLLLAQRNFRSEADESADYKHVYGLAQFALSTTETTVPLCRVIGGTTTSTRTTNTISLSRCHLRTAIKRTPTGTGSVAANQPIYRYVIWRDKVPATPGSAPTILGTDANPPASTTLMFSRLGSADPEYNSIAVFNPITAPEYHIYESGTMELNDKATYDFVTPASAHGLPAPQKWVKDHHINLFDVRQNYATYAATAPDINDIYFTCWVDMAYTNQGYQDYLTYTFDVEFEDQQD